MLQRAARNAYSWWWASHIRTKQSKWLDENLHDMEEKVEYILKIINEDGDSFAKRAEMYYRKRPELVNFVEDSFRGYRALAERYDHLSKELQSANRTIATVFPEQVQLAMDEEDDEILPTTSSSSSGIGKPTKDLPAVPNLSIPRIPKPTNRNKKMPSRLMSKKGLIKKSVPESTEGTIANSGVSKAEALDEIDDLQKQILGLQTGKEFVKSSYESGLAKYWEIENRVTEMQARVCRLQDEFGIGTVIEDDEARTLMAAAALKSCQETLVHLQEKQKQSNEDAIVEFERIKQAHKKFKTLKEQLNNNMNEQEVSENSESVTINPELENSGQQVHELELLGARIKEQLLENSSASLNMSELAEKVDELVDKVITLETAVSSQTALVKRLRSETNELHSHLQSQEEDKEALVEGSKSKRDRIKELEQELHRVQNLNRSVNTQNENLQIHFTEAGVNLDYLSENLESVKPDEENMVLFTESRGAQGVPPEKKFQFHEDVMSTGNISKISRVVESILQKDQGRSVPHLIPQNRVEGNEVVMALSEFSVIQKDVRLDEERNKDYIHDDSTSLKSKEENYVQSIMSNQLVGLTQKDQFRAAPHANPEGEFRRNEDLVVISKEVPEEEIFFLASPRNHSDNLLVNGEAIVVPDAKPGEVLEENKIAIMEEVAEKRNIIDQSSLIEAPEEDFHQARGIWDNNREKGQRENESKMSPPKSQEEKNLVLSNPFNHFDYHTVESQRTVFDANLEEGSNECKNTVSSGKDPVISKDEETIKEDTKDVIAGPGAFVNAEEANFVQSNLSNPFNDDSIGQVSAGLDSNQENLKKEHEEMMGFGQVSMIPKGMRMEAENNAAIPSYNPFEENFDRYNLGIQLDNLQHANPGKLCTDHEDMVNSGVDSAISEDAKIQEKYKKEDVLDQGDSMQAKEQRSYVHSNLTYQDLASKTDSDLDTGPKKVVIDDEDQPNWRQLFLSGLGEREKVLLEQYTSILRNYKEVKKKLSEAEEKDKDSNFKSSMQIKELQNANALKDLEIQSLHKKLNLFQDLDETLESSLAELRPSLTKVASKLRRASFRVSEFSFPNSDQKQVPNMLDEGNLKSIERTEESTAPVNAKSRSTKEEEGEEKEPNAFSAVEEKFRMDIDGLLEENLEFWLRFSTSFHQIQKFQTSVEDLQAELAKLKENKKNDGSTKHQTSNSDVRPIYRHLREIRTELALWLEHNTLLEDDLRNRFTSLCNIQEEISRLSNGGSKAEETELSDYQAGKFQGEILNMKLENSRVGDELRAGLERVKRLQVEIEGTLLELEEELGISGSKTHQSNTKNSSSRSRIPLRSFLFGVRLRKQNKSIFACMSPALQKQYSDLSTLPT